jgi:hypothetical protein
MQSLFHRVTMTILAEFPLVTIKPESEPPYSDEMLLIIFRLHLQSLYPPATDRIPILCTVAESTSCC